MSKLFEQINKTNNIVGEFCSAIFSGGTPNTTKSSYWNGNIPWLSSGETRNDYINQTEKTITDDGVKNSSTRLAKKGDIVIATAGQGLTRGQISFLNIDTYINQSLISLRADNKNLDSKYLFYNLKSRYSELRSLSDATSSRGSITCPMLYNLDINIPDYPTQKKIASILGAYDEKIENNNKIIKNLEETAQTIFNEWFVNFKFPGYEKVKMIESEMGEIPEGWKIGNIEKLCKRLPSGKVFKEDEVSINGNIPVYDQSSKGIIGFHNEKPAFDASLENPILIFGDHTCRSQIVCEPFSLGPNTIPLGEKDNYNPIFSYFLTKGLIEQREYKRHWNELISNNFIIPDFNLVDKFIKLVHPVMAQIIFNEKENISLKSQRDLLLNKLI